MAEVNRNSDIAQGGLSAVANGNLAQTDTEEREDATVSSIRAPMSEAAITMANQPVIGGFHPGELAMNRNPVTMAGHSLREHNQSSSNELYSPPPRHSQAGDTAPRATLLNPVPLQETSTTGPLESPAATSQPRITFDDYLSLSEITFEWGDSYDDKDWTRLQAILAPTLVVDYTEVNGHKWDSMPASDFVGIMSHIGFVGDPLVHTQHHIGASKWEKISDEEVIGHHQLRAAHQRYTGPDLKTVENKGHGHAMVQHLYKKVNGEWKLAGLRPMVRWNEFEFEKIFKGF